MARNPDFLRCKEERKNESFCKVVQNIDLSSENMVYFNFSLLILCLYLICMIKRALPHDFVRNFSDDDLSRIMKIKTQWGCTWEVGISKNSRFYFMDKSGWEKFVKDNALGHSEFLTFTHKREMNFTVNIFKLDGKEMMQPPQSRDFLASSSRLKGEQEEDDNIVEVSSELSNRGPATATESNGRNLNLGKKKAEEIKTFKRKKMVCRRRYFGGASSSSASAEFTIFIWESYLKYLFLPSSIAQDHMPNSDTVFKINHPDGKRSWKVSYLVRKYRKTFSAGWTLLFKEYPLAIGDTCKFTLIKPYELLLTVSKP